MRGRIVTTQRGRIDWTAYHEAIRRIPITLVLNLLGVNTGDIEGRRDGHVLCPAHGDSNTPSLHVFVDQNFAYCFGCSETYNTMTLYAAARKVDYKNAYDELGKAFGITPDAPNADNPVLLAKCAEVRERTPDKPIQRPEPLSHKVAQDLHNNLTDEQRDMYRSWGIDDWVIDQFQLGHTGMGAYQPAYTIPVWDAPGGDLFTIRYRRDDKVFSRSNLSDKQRKYFKIRKYWGTKGRNDLYPFGLWTTTLGDNFIILVESEKTVLAAATPFMPILTLTGGVGGHPKAFRTTYGKFLDKFDHIVVAYDDDRPGDSAYSKMYEMYPDKVLKFPWPLTDWGGSDPVDFFLLHSKAKFLDMALDLVDTASNRREWQPPTDKERSLWTGGDAYPKQIKWEDDL